jgi:hypothetical protein
MNDIIIRTFTDSDALLSLAGNIPWKLTGENIVWATDEEDNEYPSNLEWYDSSTPIPSKEQISAELIRLQTEWNSKEYQRLRALEYPPVTDYLDAVVKGDLAQQQAYIDTCLAVKVKYPKGEAQ